ncbi:MAG: endonuclease domain-containing protein [Bacteroidetes bacterium]|nr:endonuclease domain-containing protein [Bacteroidota bacterium]
MNYHEIKLISRKLRKQQTLYEIELWKRIRDRQLDGFKFLRQHPIIYDRNGNDLNVFIPDFYCAGARLAVEVDGGIHLQTKEYDEWRDKIITVMEIDVLRIKNEELIDMEYVLQKIRRKLSECPKPVSKRKKNIATLGRHDE